MTTLLALLLSCGPAPSWEGAGVDADAKGPGAPTDCTTRSWYADADNDGVGTSDSALSSWRVESCTRPLGYVSATGDCDDDDHLIHPRADETCDGIDNDCDGLVDGADPDVMGDGPWYTDADGDGYGAIKDKTRACEQPSGAVDRGGDCDDADPARHPGAEEKCGDPVDYNCDGSADGDDDDGDGWAACEDCDDSDASTHPDAAETCDDTDDDCDGDIDEDASDAADWYPDSDGDGAGYCDAAAPKSAVVRACEPPTGYIAAALGACGDATWDCDDANADVRPSAVELCNGIDDDCDGELDEPLAADAVDWYLDADGDGFGTSSSAARACEAPSGYAATDDDCDDADAAVYPGGDELCAAPGDEDCDGLIDEDGASDATAWYADADADGYGDADTTRAACEAPPGYVADDSDCDDLTGASYPGAAELCGGDDNDCDGVVDEGAADAVTWYADADADGYGDADDARDACEAPSGYVADDSDCDDGDDASRPGGDETCDERDEDCDEIVDEDATDADVWYIDYDADGFGSASYTAAGCEAPSGYADNAADCDDIAPETWPDAPELCDGDDNDCDGSADEGTAESLWYPDDDGDGYGASSGAILSCVAPSGYVEDDNDCDDADARAWPGHGEDDGDGADNDCDGETDEGSPLFDAEGFFAGEDTGDWAGSDLAGVGDVDGDGYDDLLIGASNGDVHGDDAIAYLVDGDNALTISSLADADARFTQATDGRDAGRAVAGAGDVNADGYGDLLIGDPEATGFNGDTTGRLGSAYLILGPVTGDLSLDAADHSWLGEDENDYAGRSLAGPGDVDDDGYDDLLIGAPYESTTDTSAGAIYLLSGSDAISSGGSSAIDDHAAAILRGEAAGDTAGAALDGVGDLDGDGAADLLIGVPGEDFAGAACLVYGGSWLSGELLLSDADAIWTGEASGDQAGEEVAGAGDVDGDGYPDLMISAPREASAGLGAGAIYLILGASSMSDGSLSDADAKRTGEAAGDDAGTAIAGPGDVDADGYDDLLIGAPDESSVESLAGAAYLLLGPVTGNASLSTADAKLLGERDGDWESQSGAAVSGAGDVNDDGYADLLVGNAGDFSGGGARGYTWLILGKPW